MALATGVATITFPDPFPYEYVGTQKVVHARVSFPASYVTGGVLITPNSVFLSTINRARATQILTGVASSSVENLVCVYDIGNQALQLFGDSITEGSPGGLDEVDTTSDWHLLVFDVEFWGIG
jgi:hypothetical protein